MLGHISLNIGDKTTILHVRDKIYLPQASKDHNNDILSVTYLRNYMTFNRVIFNIKIDFSQRKFSFHINKYLLQSFNNIGYIPVKKENKNIISLVE